MGPLHQFNEYLLSQKRLKQKQNEIKELYEALDELNQWVLNLKDWETMENSKMKDPPVYKAITTLKKVKKSINNQ